MQRHTERHWTGETSPGVTGFATRQSPPPQRKSAPTRRPRRCVKSFALATAAYSPAQRGRGSSGALISLTTRSMPGRGFGLPPRGCVACGSVLASFTSERATGTAFGNTSCVGSVGTSAASTEWSAEKEASTVKALTRRRIGVLSSVFRTADTSHSDKQAPRGPFREFPHEPPPRRKRSEPGQSWRRWPIGVCTRAR